MTEQTVRLVNFLVGLVFMLCYSYQFVYIGISFFTRKRPPRACKAAPHRFAVLICARNESAVVGHLIDSIAAQEYPRELLDVFVCADNCTDDTAAVARAHGATVFERFNTEYVGKGYAMRFLLEHVAEVSADAPYDGFFVFDADNLLDKHYVAEMNEVFSRGYNVVTSYRNSKNFGDNWVSSGYSLWFLHEARHLSAPRMKLKTSCAVSGTGFMFSREVIEACGGWHYFLLTEDIEFSIENVIRGERIGYAERAEFYDEHPVKFKQSWRQRERWAKGYLQVFRHYGTRLAKGLFSRMGFACYDMVMIIYPAFFLSMFSLAFNLVALVLNLCLGLPVGEVLHSLLTLTFNSYLLMMLLGELTLISEWKRIRATAAEKLASLFTFPLFMITFLPISIGALFKKVEWKPISHTVGKSLQELENGK